MRARVLILMVATLLASAGCVESERPTASATPSPSSETLTQRYELTPRVCEAIDFNLLEPIFNEATEPVEVRDQPRQGWMNSGNFLYKGGVKCSQMYGTGQERKILLVVHLAMYESAVGSRLAYDSRFGYDSRSDNYKRAVEGSLPVGVELMSHLLDNSYSVYVCDGNLFAQIDVLVMGDGRLADEGLAQSAPPAVDAFANHVIERLRADFTTGRAGAAGRPTATECSNRGR